MSSLPPLRATADAQLRPWALSQGNGKRRSRGAGGCEGFDLTQVQGQTLGSEIKDSSAQKVVGVDEDSLVLVDTLQPLADGLEGLQPERLRLSQPRHTSLGRMVLLISPPRPHSSKMTSVLALCLDSSIASRSMSSPAPYASHIWPISNSGNEPGVASGSEKT